MLNYRWLFFFRRTCIHTWYASRLCVYILNAAFACIVSRRCSCVVVYRSMFLHTYFILIYKINMHRQSLTRFSNQKLAQSLLVSHSGYSAKVRSSIARSRSHCIYANRKDDKWLSLSNIYDWLGVFHQTKKLIHRKEITSYLNFFLAYIVAWNCQV